MIKKLKKELENIKQMTYNEFESYFKQKMYINILIILGISLAITLFKNIFLITYSFNIYIIFNSIH